MSEILAIAPADWLEIKNAQQLMTDSGYENGYWYELMASKQWPAFETLYDMFLPPNTSTADAQILSDSIFVKTFSTLAV